ncbi:hypothetical protein [Arthrobacter wenxiniae]|uniref:Uncharacterized protein n=1 Tax=Arthrobacter wenxiniae TaxID=2713570 RepID=A0A7Y7M054_9MICC|nr:hypothetical protein [Arthrobacter wenxiniae]NVM95381.1 hypothetical protein [Arthrobacter wenxiniae]
MLDFRGLAHRCEDSRLLLAPASTVIVFGAVVVWIVIVLPGLAVPWLAPVVPAALVVDVTIWLGYIVQTVRASLGCRRRVDVYVAEKASGTVSMFNVMGTRFLLVDGGPVADLQEARRRPRRTSTRWIRPPAGGW